MQQICDNIYQFDDTCFVYVVKLGEQAILIDFGSGDVLDALPTIGVKEVAAILMTHHHRDQGQGLPRAAAANIPIYVPHTEQDLFHSVDDHWQARTVMNSYDNRQDRFSLLQSVPVAATLKDYATYTFCGQPFTIIPTPGHTQGSISIETRLNHNHLIFSGDLIAGHGKIWSLAATQWSYNGAEGVAASIPSLLELKKRQPDMLLPSHGEIITDIDNAVDAVVSQLTRLLEYRHQNTRLFQLMEKPYREITPHLLFNQTSFSNAYVVLSNSGKALLIDFGYDFTTGIPSGSDRSSRRPSLYTIRKLKEQYGVTKIDVVLPTHYHDDHVAGINLLRDNEGTACWAAENFYDLLQNPTHYDLPCLWYDPIPVDKIVPLETAIQWEEYTFTLYGLPGHTRYAVGIAFEIDGKRVLAAGDQYQGNAGVDYNYVYKNDYQIGDYIRSAALYRRLQPDIILTGHWEPMQVTPDYYDGLDEIGTVIDNLHSDLLPLEQVGFDANGFAGRIKPYQNFVAAGTSFDVEVAVHNPYKEGAEACVNLVIPEGWQVHPIQQLVSLPASGIVQGICFTITPASNATRRARIAADITINAHHFGQQAEALVTVTDAQ